MLLSRVDLQFAIYDGSAQLPIWLTGIYEGCYWYLSIYYISRNLTHIVNLITDNESITI